MSEREETNVLRRVALNEERTARGFERQDCRIVALERGLRELRANIKQIAAEKESHARSTD